MTPKCPDCRHDQDECICIPFEMQINQLTEERDALKAALEIAAAAFWKLDNADIHAQEAEEVLEAWRAMK